MAPQGVLLELEAQGFTNIDQLEQENFGETLGTDEFAQINLDPSVCAVVLGITRKFNFKQLATMSLYLQQKDMQFFVTNEDRVYSAGRNQGANGESRTIADIGATLRMLEVASGRRADRMGKPETFAFESIIHDHFNLKGKDVDKN